MLIDTFCVFNELDILDIRLAELYPVVDRFVLVEATRTHKGDAKPLYYAEHRQRYADYNDKIIHIVYGDMPTGDSQAAIWRREIGQRQAITRGLRDVPDDAVVMVSDLDEIPRREVVRYLANGLPDDLIATFDQTLYYGFVNKYCTNMRWSGTRATAASNVRVLTPDGVRWETLKPRSNEYPRHGRIENAGWHLSYFGDAEHIQQKMRSFLHQELVSEENTSLGTIERRRLGTDDLWGRSEQVFALGPAPDLPWAMRCDPVKYAQYFHPDWAPSFTEDWYQSEQLAVVGHFAQSAPQTGAMVEIGCWEGRSAACIAQSIAPRQLIAVDHWRGNEDELAAKGGDGAQPFVDFGVEAAKERDVLATFVCNMELLTSGNWQHFVMDWRDWIKGWNEPIAFLHLDAAHDYKSVKDCLDAIKPHLVPGAVLCGDDYYGDGVHRAVNDALRAGVQDISGRLWVWQNKAE